MADPNAAHASPSGPAPGRGPRSKRTLAAVFLLLLAWSLYEWFGAADPGSRAREVASLAIVLSMLALVLPQAWRVPRLVEVGLVGLAAALSGYTAVVRWGVGEHGLATLYAFMAAALMAWFFMSRTPSGGSGPAERIAPGTGAP